MRRFLCCIVMIFFAGVYGDSSWEPQTEEESLFLRRIADFWEEGEIHLVKEQIEEFLCDYPESSFSETLHATLGDLYLKEKKFNDALAQYACITERESADRVFLNRMQCLLELQWFATLADECDSYLKKEAIDPAQKLRATYLLAISIYQQCLNAPKDSEILSSLAQRALPHFQLLWQSEFSDEVAQGMAHLYCLLKDFSSASNVYLKLAEKNEEKREAMLFQAALLQAEIDKKLALQTFHTIAQMNQARVGDAFYHILILTFDSDQHEELIDQKEQFLAKIPEEKCLSAHLFFGRSYLKLKRYPDALAELSLYTAAAEPSETLRSALVDLLDASYKAGDENTLQKTLVRFSELFPQDLQLPKGFLAHALLLKQDQRIQEARQEFEALCKRFPDALSIENVLFEQLHLEFQDRKWEACRSFCREYLQNFAKNDTATFVWRFLTASSSQLAAETPDAPLKQQLVRDLETMLKEDRGLSQGERYDWTFLLAKTYYELKDYATAISLLESLIEVNFSQRANAHLLLALCYRDGLGNIPQFCNLGETALALEADLLPPSTLHVALFNAYLSRKEETLIPLSAEHLYLASNQPGEVQQDHLLWLGDYYYKKFHHDPKDQTSAQRSLYAKEQFLSQLGCDLQSLDETILSFESSLVQLAELRGKLGQSSQQLALLEDIKKQQETHPTWAWKEESRIDLMLAEQYAKLNRENEALQLFEKIVTRHPTVRSPISASACLQGARLRQRLSNHSPEESSKVLAQLKTLMLQKTLANEPIHLEAAIEYVDLQTELTNPNNRIEKQLTLLNKAKVDFEASNDLLSLDYQNSRKILVDQDRIYQAYMRFLDAEICLCRSMLASGSPFGAEQLEQAKKYFNEIALDPPTEFLSEKVHRQLEALK